MKRTLIILFIIIGWNYSSQAVGFPSNITISNVSKLDSNITKVSTFPIYIDNVHSIAPIKGGKMWGGERFGINLQNNVPTVCVDDYRYGHKFDNPYGDDAIGYLSLMYWLPSNGDYLLFFYTLENGEDHYKSFLVTTTLSGQYIDHLLVNDGWSSEPRNVNFTQAVLSSDFIIDWYEVRNLNTTYVSPSNINTFYGRIVNRLYHLNSTGHFVNIYEYTRSTRMFNIIELKNPLYYLW